MRGSLLHWNKHLNPEYVKQLKPSEIITMYKIVKSSLKK